MLKLKILCKHDNSAGKKVGSIMGVYRFVTGGVCDVMGEVIRHCQNKTICQSWIGPCQGVTNNATLFFPHPNMVGCGQHVVVSSSSSFLVLSNLSVSGLAFTVIYFSILSHL